MRIQAWMDSILLSPTEVVWRRISFKKAKKLILYILSIHVQNEEVRINDR